AGRGVATADMAASPAKPECDRAGAGFGAFLAHIITRDDLRNSAGVRAFRHDYRRSAKSEHEASAARYRSCSKQMPSSPRVDPKAELIAVNPGNAASRNSGWLRKWRQSRHCPFSVVIPADVTNRLQTRRPTAPGRAAH